MTSMIRNASGRLSSTCLTASRAIVSAPYWPHLRTFHHHLGENGYCPEEAKELAAAPPAPNLRLLYFPGSLGDAFAALAASPVLASVTSLTVSAGDNRAIHLAKSPHLGRLVSLSVSGCGPQELKALAEAPFAANLVTLGVNTLNKAGVDVLVAPGAFPRLKRLTAWRAVRLKAQAARLRARFGDRVLL